MHCCVGLQNLKPLSHIKQTLVLRAMSEIRTIYSSVSKRIQTFCDIFRNLNSSNTAKRIAPRAARSHAIFSYVDVRFLKWLGSETASDIGGLLYGT